MKSKIQISFIVSVLLAGISLFAQAKPADSNNNGNLPLTMIPVDRSGGKHNSIKAAYAKSSPGPVVLFGDSLTDNWRGPLFNGMREKFNIVNAGICGDRIEQLLWRVNDMAGLMTTNPPSVACVMIGTNNFRKDVTTEDIFLGTSNIVARIRVITPKTKVVIFGIPPMAMPHLKRAYPYSASANALSRTLADGNDVVFFDFGTELMDPLTGKLNTELYSGDCCHFNPTGYAEVIEPWFTGAIRLVTAKNLPKNFFKNNALWYKYLHDRMAEAERIHFTEEYYRNDYHIGTLPAYWKGEFERIAADPEAVPQMPEEYIRQSKEEGLPGFFE